MTEDSEESISHVNELIGTMDDQSMSYFVQARTRANPT